MHPLLAAPPFGNIRVDPMHAYRSSNGAALRLEGWLSMVLRLVAPRPQPGGTLAVFSPISALQSR